MLIVGYLFICSFSHSFVRSFVYSFEFIYSVSQSVIQNNFHHRAVIGSPCSSEVVHFEEWRRLMIWICIWVHPNAQYGNLTKNKQILIWLFVGQGYPCLNFNASQSWNFTKGSIPGPWPSDQFCTLPKDSCGIALNRGGRAWSNLSRSPGLGGLATGIADAKIRALKMKDLRREAPVICWLFLRKGISEPGRVVIFRRSIKVGNPLKFL